MKKLANPITFALLSTTLLVGCTKRPTDPQDPYEKFNRNMYHLNNTIDKVLYRPVAKAYKTVTPRVLRDGVSNFFDNLFEPNTIVNDLLQGKPHYAIRDFGRLVFNSTIGLGGLIDVASRMNIQKHPNDFGKTFAYWSKNKKSAFLMLPLYGPRTIRDTIGLPLDFAVNPATYLQARTIKYPLAALYFVDIRAELLPLDKMVEESFDPYAAIRNAYLQQRNQAIIQNSEEGDYKFGQKKVVHASLNKYVKQSHKNTAPPPEEDFTFDEKPKLKN